MRLSYQTVLETLHLPGALAAFKAHVVGTPPLGLETPNSDIDIICQCSDFTPLAARVEELYKDQPGFCISARIIRHIPSWICRFQTLGWPVEIFAQDVPVEQQMGWRHFQIERRLLTLFGDRLRAQILALRSQGLKTEPAFSAALGLSGDPYLALLALEAEPDAALLQRFKTMI